MEPNFYPKESEFLITGGTGSLGKTLVKLLQRYKPKGIRIYSRDELKQWKLRQQFAEYDNIAYLLGDVRDYTRLERAMNGVDVVFHCAAMKQVPACETDPEEAVKTNIHGAQNVMNAAINNNVKVVMNISTDKAVYPVNLYGATKMAAEKLFIHGNVYSGDYGTKFSCCRYGNVLGSRGSIIPLFLEQQKTGVITITHPKMTRFFIRLEEVAQFVINAAYITDGGQIYVPKMKAMKVLDAAKVIAPNAAIKLIGIRPGEKLHECLITKEESYHATEKKNMYIIDQNVNTGNEFTLDSNSVTQYTEDDFRELVKEFF